MNDKVGFECYECEGKPVIPDSVTRSNWGKCQKMYAVDSGNMFFKDPPPDNRWKLIKFAAMWKRRFAHAWDALRGYDCD